MATYSPIVSGIAYPIVSVAGRPCQALDDLTGDLAEFTIEHDGLYTARGSSFQQDGAVRFYEKDSDGVGKDVRVWELTGSPEGGFTAVHVAGA